MFHAGTALGDGLVVTNGGRVLNVTATGDTLAAARQRAYAAAERISWDGMRYRGDIAGCRRGMTDGADAADGGEAFSPGGLEELGFDWRATRDGTVFVTWRGRTIRTFAGPRA